MKNVLKTLAILGAFLTFISGCAYCVKIDDEYPYKGEYVYLFNGEDTAVQIDGMPTLSDFSLDIKQDNSFSENIMGKIEIDGEILYIEEPKLPENLDFGGVMLFSLNDNYRTFSAVDTHKNSLYAFCANKRYETDNCKVYIEENAIANISDENMIAKNLGDKFDEIFAYINQNFSEYSGDTTILIHDIKDSYYYGEGSSFMAGYFNQSEYNTERIVHIDIYPLMGKDSSSLLNPNNAQKTLAHEFTHLVEYSVNKDNGNINDMWFSELFALSTEGALFKDYSDSNRLYDLANDYNGIIKKGTILNYSAYADNSSDVSANYGLLYAFSSYLKTQYGEDLFKTVLENSANATSEEQAVLDAVKTKSGEEITFPELVKNFYMAMVLNEESGSYKTMDTNIEHLLKLPLGISESITLKPKASVVVPLFNEEFDPSELSENVSWTVFSKDGNQQIGEISVGADNKVNTVLKNMIQVINPEIDGKNLLIAGEGLNTELYGKLLFVPEDESMVFFGTNGVVYGKKTGTVNVRCQSLMDKNIYTDFDLIISEMPVCINKYSSPKYDSVNKGFALNVSLFNTIYQEEPTVDIILAVYDKENVLIKCTSLERTFPSSGIIYGRGIKFDEAKEDGEYIFKMFVFKSDDKMTPVAKAYKINYNID